MVMYYLPTSEFGRWLYDARRAAHLTQEELAQRVKLPEKNRISKSYISTLERGGEHPLTGRPVMPSIEIVEALAYALDADVDDARLAAGYAPRNLPPKDPDLPFAPHAGPALPFDPNDPAVAALVERIAVRATEIIREREPDADKPEILAFLEGLPPEDRKAAEDFIRYLASKYQRDPAIDEDY